MLVLAGMERVEVNPCAIPAASIRAASQHMTPDDAEMFRVCIRAMDREFLNIHHGKSEAPPQETAKDAFRAAFKR